MHRIPWGDLRFVLAVAQQGSAAAAARALQVNHSTVIRRIRAFERQQGVRIFDHLATGYRLTAAGELFLDTARAIDGAIVELERKLVGDRDELDGQVRITTTDGLFPLLGDLIGELRRLYPQLTLELLLTNRHLNLDTLDADIAIRPTLTPPDSLIGRHACNLAFAIYGAPSLRRDGIFPPLDQCDWLGMGDPLSASVPGRWLNETVGEKAVTVRCNSFLAMLELAGHGIGYALLPCYLGDRSPRVRRVQAEPLAFRNQIWLLSHRDVLRSQRVLACRDFLCRRLREQQPMLEGRAPP